MQVSISEIKINERVRADMGDLKPLMDSMQANGQLNPITLSRENELIAGHRRTLAARELGWEFIEAKITDAVTEVEKLRLELEENVHRKDFSPEELLAGYRKLDKLSHPSALKRFTGAIHRFFSKIFKRRSSHKAAPASTELNPKSQTDPDVYGV